MTTNTTLDRLDREATFYWWLAVVVAAAFAVTGHAYIAIGVVAVGMVANPIVMIVTHLVDVRVPHPRRVWRSRAGWDGRV